MHVPPVAEAGMRVLMSDLPPERQPCMCMRQRVGWVLNSRLLLGLNRTSGSGLFPGRCACLDPDCAERTNLMTGVDRWPAAAGESCTM